MTSHGALAVLAELPEDAKARHVQLLVALETYPAGAEGWREVGGDQLCKAARLGRTSLRRAARG